MSARRERKRLRPRSLVVFGVSACVAALYGTFTHREPASGGDAFAKREDAKEAGLLAGTSEVDVDRFARALPIEAAPLGFVVEDGDILIDEKSAREPYESAKRQPRAWECGLIPYRFASAGQHAVGEGTRVATREAMREWSARVPVRFVELGPNEVVENWLEVRQWTYGWGISAVGERGGGQEIYLPSDTSIRLATHELGHTLGLFHAHQHPGREAFMAVHYDCLEPEHRKGFLPRDRSLFFGDYDVASVMHYRSSGFCRSDAEDLDDDGNTDECAYYWDGDQLRRCLVLERVTGTCSEDICQDRDHDGRREFIDGASLPSAGDVAALRQLYAERVLLDDRGLPGLGEMIQRVDLDGDRRPEMVAISRHASALTALVYRQLGESFHLCDAVEFSGEGAREASKGAPPTLLAATVDFDGEGHESLVLSAEGALIAIEQRDAELGSSHRIAARTLPKIEPAAAGEIRRFAFLDVDKTTSDPELVVAHWAKGALRGSVLIYAQAEENWRLIQSLDASSAAGIEARIGGSPMLSWSTLRDRVDDAFAEDLIVGDFRAEPGSELAVAVPCRWHHGAVCAGGIDLYVTNGERLEYRQSLALPGERPFLEGARFGESMATLGQAGLSAQALVVDAPFLNERGDAQRRNPSAQAIVTVFDLRNEGDHEMQPVLAFDGTQTQDRKRMLAALALGADARQRWVAIGDAARGQVMVGALADREGVALGGSKWAQESGFATSFAWFSAPANDGGADRPLLAVGVPFANDGGQIYVYAREQTGVWRLKRVLGGAAE
jgi:hypothetical protein